VISFTRSIIPAIGKNIYPLARLDVAIVAKAVVVKIEFCAKIHAALVDCTDPRRTGAMPTDTFEDSLEPLRYVTAATGLKRSAIYRKIGEGEFPRPAKIGYASRWSRREVQEWVQARLRARVAA
jgi:prophage regulatory protein